MKQLFPLAFCLAAQLLFSQNGIVWEPAQNVATSTFGHAHPRIALDASGNPLLLWGKEGSNKTYFSRWSGGAFVAPQLMNPANIPVFAASWAGPDLAAHGDTVYVTFKQSPEDAQHPIFVIRSFDGGASFSAPVQVDAFTDSISRFTTVTTDDAGNPLVAFMKFDPGFGNARYVVARSQDFGATFSPDVRASGFSGGTVCDCCPAAVVSAGNTVAMLYRDNLNNIRDTWAGISTDGGQTFPQGMGVDNSNWFINACPSTGPDGILLGDTLYSVFMSAASGSPRCFLSRASISTMTAGTSEPITGGLSGITAQNYPRIEHDGPAVAIALKQTANGTNQVALFFARDIRDGKPPVFESVASANAANADVALRNGQIYVVWEDVNSGTVKFRKGTYPSTSVNNAGEQPLAKFYPNPARAGDCLVFEKTEFNGLIFKLFNVSGVEIFSEKICNGRVFLPEKTGAGAFVFRVENALGGVVGSGKLAVQRTF